MSLDVEPQRLLEDSREDAELRRLLSAAQIDGPTASQIAVMAQKLSVKAPASPQHHDSAHEKPNSEDALVKPTSSIVTQVLTNTWFQLVIAGAIATLGVLLFVHRTQMKLTKRSELPVAALPMRKAANPRVVRSAQTSSEEPKIESLSPSSLIDSSGNDSALTKVKKGGAGSTARTPIKADKRSRMNEADVPAQQFTLRGNAIEAEFELIQQAQRLLARAPRLALKLVAQHETRFPRGELVPEREVIAIEALWTSEQRQAARTRAQTFLQRFPTSNYQNKVRALLKEVER